MRLNESIVIAAPPKLVWDYLAEPSNYLHFMSGITRWEVEGEQRTGLGARYRMLIRVGSAEVGGLIEIVEWDEQRDMAWSSVLGSRPAGAMASARARRWPYPGRAALRLRRRRLRDPRLDRRAASRRRQLGGHLRRSLRQLKRQVEHERLRADGRPAPWRAGCRGRLALLAVDRGQELALVHPRAPFDVQPLGLAVELFTGLAPGAAAARALAAAAPRRDVLGRGSRALSSTLPLEPAPFERSSRRSPRRGAPRCRVASGSA